MKKLLFLLSSIIFFLPAACSDFSSNPPSPTPIYSNSFESIDNIKNWEGVDKTCISDSAAPGCGKKSLHVCGGCVQPAAYFVVKTDPCLGLFQFSFWARSSMSNQKPSVRLTNGQQDSNKTELNVEVTSTAWQHYSQKTILFQNYGNITIEIYVGGIVSCCVFVDDIKIVPVYD